MGLNKKRSKSEKRVHKISKKNICEILNFSRSQLSFRARKKRSVGSWCPTYIFLLPKRYINNLQQKLGRKLMKPICRKIISREKNTYSFPSQPALLLIKYQVQSRARSRATRARKDFDFASWTRETA